MKKSICSIVFLLVSVAAIFAQEIDPNTYYYKSGNAELAKSYTLSDGVTVPTVAPSSITNVVIEKGFWFNWFLIPNKQLLQSITLNGNSGGTFNLNGGNYVATVKDYVNNLVSSKITDVAVRLTQMGQGTNGNNGFNIGENMIMNSTGYQTTIMQSIATSFYKVKTLVVGDDGTNAWKYQTYTDVETPVWSVDENNPYLFNVGKQIQFNHTGDTGFIRFQMSETTTWNDTTDAFYATYQDYVDKVKTGEKITFQYKAVVGDVVVNGTIGGLSGKGVLSSTKWLNTTANLNFKSDTFIGGDFSGALTQYSASNYSLTSSDVSQKFVAENAMDENGNIISTSVINIQMNGDKKQSMKIVKAANAEAELGISGISTERDMTIGTLTVNSGEFVMDTELAVTNVVLSGGKLTFTSPEKITTALTLEGGQLGYAGTISTNEFSVPATSIDVVFTAQDLQAQEIVLVQFDYLGDEFDADSIFAAYNESGEKLGGTFVLNGSLGEAGTLTYQVPESATVAAIFGMAALAFAAWRRRK